MARRININCRLVRHLLGIIIIAFFPSLLPGLDPEKPLAHYLVDKWDTADGIPSEAIRSIVQTPDGYLWIAAEKGLVRFDGKTFSSIHFAEGDGIDSMKGTIPEALFVDKENTLWIGSAVGLTSYRCQTRRFRTFTPGDGLTRDSIRRIEDDIGGNLWISFISGYVDRFSNGEFKAFNASHGLTGKKINAIVEDPKGNLLFGSREDGVFIYKDEKFSRYAIPGLDNCQLIFMYWDRRGELWIGTKNGLFRVTGEGTREYTTAHGLSNNFIMCMLEDSDRNLWMGTFNGLNRVKRKQDGSIGFESILEPFEIYCLFEDREKSLWLGTSNSGIRRLKDRKFISYAPFEDRPWEMPVSIFQDRRGDTWIGAYDGKLFHCRGNKLIQSLQLPGLSGNIILSIAEDAEGNLWLGTTGKGVFHKKNTTFTRYTKGDGLADNTVTSIFKDSRDTLWFGTFDGVSFIRGDAYRRGGVTVRSLTAREGLKGNKVHNVYEDKNQNIWIAADKGITVLKDGNIGKKDKTYYCAGVSVTCIYEDPAASSDGSHVYWIATDGHGFRRVTLKNGALTSVTSFTTADGMGSNFIFQFFEDQQGDFWLMSNSGVLRVGKNELNRFANQPPGRGSIRCTSYGITDGMNSTDFDNQYSRHSALKTRDGEFLFITKKGISVVNPANVYINKISPPVAIETVLFDRQPVPLDGETHLFKGITEARFYFNAPTFLSPEKTAFRYRLEGFDGQSVFLPPGGKREVIYRNPGPGTYTFTVTACNSEGVWNRTGASFTFTLKPLFYQTVLFKIGVFFVLIFLAAAGFYIYKKRPLERKVKYKGPHPNPRFVDECVKKLTYLMEVEHLYRKPDLSLSVLAERLSVSPHLLSQVLNERMNRNFADFINSYRIDEARKIFEKPGGTKKKIEMVAFEVGFNTIMAFYNAFKKYTGMTPARYKKKTGNKK